MRNKSWVLFCFFCLINLQLIDSQAQKIQKKFVVSWTDNVFQSVSEELSKEFLHFDGAIYLREQAELPVFYEKIPVDIFFEDYEVLVSDVQYEPMSPHDCALLKDMYQDPELKVRVESVSERTRHYAQICFVPIIRTGSNQYSRVTSLTIQLEGKHPVAKSAKSHVSRSVLASGQWFRFTVGQTGIYKVTFQDLTAMGMSKPIASHQIALFGNGGKMLSETNSTPRIEDLREIPVLLFDGGDGSFDENDYFIFYGESPHTVYYDTASQRFAHTTNIYADSTVYFITQTPGVGEKKRVQTVDNSGLSANKMVNDYTHFAFYEEDIYNLGSSGKDWFGDLFDVTTQRAYSFPVPSYKSENARVSVSLAGVSNSYSQMAVAVNNIDVGNVFMSPTTSTYMATFGKGDFSFMPNGGNLTVSLTYSKPLTTSTAYLNWIEIEVPCNLTMHSAQFGFCNPSTAGSGNVTQFNISSPRPNTFVWDVTNPGQVVQHALTSGNGFASFKVPTEDIRFFYAFDGTSYLTVTSCGAVANQNLHATDRVDMVIVTHRDFLSQANRLADYRQQQNGYSVKVVTIDEVYNEFSGGSQDPMAIRDYMKMIYDKTEKVYPKYLLLVGRPSYDYRGRNEGTRIFVPNYQYYAGASGVSEFDFYANDDNFGLLDDDESATRGEYDLPIGRFPCTTVSEATNMVDKSIRYTEQRNLLSDNSTQISNLGDWRNVMAFVADDEQMDFIQDAESFYGIVDTTNSNINFDKIYLDAFQQVSNAGGQRYPEVTAAINSRMNRGCLMMTYVGHSGKDGWAAERVLENSDISRWSNYYNLPFLFSLSCTFSYYDRPSWSPAELAILNNKGGAAAVLSASRESWSLSNADYGKKLFQKIFSQTENRYPTVGELNIQSKNDKGGAITSLAMYVLLGDPSMPLAIPRYHFVTDSINHVSVTQQLDTVRALSKVTVSGRVVDDNGQTLTDYNGSVFPSVFDKKMKTSTLANDPGCEPYDFYTQKSMLFRGNATVKNGHFTFSFYVPKDIDYSFGNGKISYYARGSHRDAAGAFTNFIIGGTDTNGLNDKEGPMIELYLNDENFVDGGVVNPNPTLIAKIKDNYGINTTGNGIGHDLTAILDGKTDAQIVLNDYYETEKDSFNTGTVRYALSDLKVGKHTLKVRAWDINNNPSERELSFEVLSDRKFELSHVLNYPNPFTTHTEFFFEHNQNGGMFDIQVQIFTISGKLVRTINTSQYMEGNRCTGIPWDGLDDYGDKIGKGVYMYRVRVRNQNNEIAEKIEKLVIL